MHPIENPFLESLGVSLTAWSADRAEMTLTLNASLLNRVGRVQGGVLCTLLDAVCGYAGLFSEPHESRKRNVSLSLTTNFLDAGDGERLIAKGVVERRGKGIYFARGEVWLDDRLLLATGMGTFKYLKPLGEGD